MRVIVKGEPASGKTTFVKKICQEWSMLHQRNEEPVSSEIRDTLGQYDLLIPIILRLVKHRATVEETIEEQIDLNDKQVLTLRYMLKNTKRTALVLDGLDEYNTKTSRDITDIMRGNTFKHVIITSRAEAVNKTQEWKQIMYKEAELKGFSDENIKLYVDKFFKTSKDLASSLISHIFQKDSNLLKLARNPGSLCMLCILHKDKIPIHSMNREQLYEEYVAFLLSRWEQRQNPEGEKTDRSEILKKYHEILLKFGELSHINRKPYTRDDDDDSSDSEYDSDSVKSSDNEDAYDIDRDDEDSMELSFRLDQVKSHIGEDAFNYGFLYKSHPSSGLVSSRYSFIHKTLHEFFLAYFIKHHNLESFKQRIYKNRNLLLQELSLTRFLLHLYMSPKQALEFITNIIGSKPDEFIFLVLLKLYEGYQHDEYQTTLTFKDYCNIYIYIYQYPCYVIRADRRHQDSLLSYNKDMIRRMNTDKKHKAVTVPILQTASKQAIACGDTWFEYDFYVYCRADYEVTVTGDGSKLKVLYLSHIEKMGDINVNPVYDNLSVDIHDTNLHGWVGLSKPWMALIQSLEMPYCKLEAGDISVIADSIHTCTSPTGAESASPSRLQKLDLGGNNLTGAGADIARMMPLCTEIDLSECKLEAGDISVIADSIHTCTSPTGAESASPCRLQKLDLRHNNLTGAGADIARIMPLCTKIDLFMCKLEAGDISAMADSIHTCTSPTGAESASPCRLQKLNLEGNSLTGAGADIARIMPLCTEIYLSECKLEAGDISAMADSIHTYTSPTGAESVSPCRLQKLNLSHNNLTGAGADIARIMPLCTDIDLSECKLEAGDISAMADSIQPCTSPTGAESASPCRLQKLNLSHNNLTGAGADIARIMPLCTDIDLSECKLEAGDISAMADSIQPCTSPTGAESASPCRLQKLGLRYNSLTGAGADVARIISCIPLCTVINLELCDLNDEDFHAIVNAITQTHSDRHTSVHDHSTADRRQTSKWKAFWHKFIKHVKPASPGPASHIERLGLHSNKFSDVETLRLLLDNLPPSLRCLSLSHNQFNKEEIEEIRRTYKDKHPDLDLEI